jgi:hypothetical protein
VKNGMNAIEHYVKKLGFKMVQFQANMHAYRPDRALDWAARSAAEVHLRHRSSSQGPR